MNRMKVCPECYSEYNRSTPNLHPQECLEQHLQYCCGTCGRCICIGKDTIRGLYRWNFPFRTLDKAKQYLRTADVTAKHSCGIYELRNDKDRVSYKIFEDKQQLHEYLLKNKDKHCDLMRPIFEVEVYKEYADTQIKKLTRKEIQQYLDEQTIGGNKNET